MWRAGVRRPAEEAAAGARLIVNISASPYHAGKGLEREHLFAQRARECRAHIAFCGLVGGQDELVFDGHSFVLDPTGATIARAAQFEEDMLVCELDLAACAALARSRETACAAWRRSPRRRPRSTRRCASACATTCRRTASPTWCSGSPAGSTPRWSACLAVDALGAERVSVAIMPSPYSSAATQDDARALAAALGVRVHELPIAAPMDAYTATLQAEFAGREADLTEENLQARIRGNLLMALSNKFGWLVLTTGNKSEMSVGYTTLYGDLAGGFAVIKDVPKTLVYRLCEWRNSDAGSQPGPAGGSRRARRGADPRIDHRPRPLRGAAREPARRGLAAPV